MAASAWTSYTFRMYEETRRPWITVYDPHGFPDPWINPYLTFLAWQGARPAQVRRQARHLVAASHWLAGRNTTWGAQTLGDWGTYYHLAMVKQSPRTVRSHLETLYHFYGFWHWYDPRQMAVQPFPDNARERTAWLDRTRVDDAGELPTLLPW